MAEPLPPADGNVGTPHAPIATSHPFYVIIESLGSDALEHQLTQRWPDARLVVFGHLGDGNLHISVCVGSHELAVRREVETLVYQPLAALGGSVSAEHGIGLEKRPWLETCRSAEEVALMHTLKQALDPHKLLNRGKILR